jgi:hypothetical protein
MSAGLQQVHTMLHGMNTTDVGIEAANTTVFHCMRYLFDKAVEFMSAYISNPHAGAQAEYANRADTVVAVVAVGDAM